MAIFKPNINKKDKNKDEANEFKASDFDINSDMIDSNQEEFEQIKKEVKIKPQTEINESQDISNDEIDLTIVTTRIVYFKDKVLSSSTTTEEKKGKINY